MGLDSVELVIGYEYAFGIDIPDEAAGAMRTPRQVVDYVLPRLASAERAPCLHLQAFHLVRRGFGGTLGIPRKRIRPDTPLEEIVPREARAGVWRDLAATLGVAPKSELGRTTWPALVRPVWLRWMGLAWLLAVLAGSALGLRRAGWSTLDAILLGTVLAAGALYLGAILTRGLRTRFPRDAATLGHVVEHVAARVPHAAVGGRHGWTREQVEWVVRRVTMDVLGITRFSLDDEFARDLGVS